MKYRYFRRSNGCLYKLGDKPTFNLHSTDGGETWHPTCFLLSEFLDPEYWVSEGQPVEYSPDTEQPDTEQPDTEQPDTEQPDTEQPDTEQPSYRYFRQGKGEWKVQTADPESTEGNFYRNAETPWLSASHSLSDLLAMGATEVGASEEQMPRWAVAGAFTKSCGVMALKLLVTSNASTEAEAIGQFTEAVHKEFPGASIQKPVIIRVP